MSLSSLYPVIAEVAAEAKVRPERALSGNGHCSQVWQWLPSPMSAATAGMLAILHEYAGIHVRAKYYLLPFLRFLCCNCYQLFSLAMRGKELEDES